MSVVIRLWSEMYMVMNGYEGVVEWDEGGIYGICCN